MTTRQAMFYRGFCADYTELEWVTTTIENELAEQYEQGAKLPGGEELQKEMSTDLLEPMPSLPKLNVLTIEQDDFTSKLCISAAEVRKWSNGTISSKEFSEWLDKFIQAGHIVKEDAAAQGTPQKRKGTPSLLDENTPKRPATNTTIVETESIAETLLKEVKVTAQGKEEVWMQLRTGNTAFIINKSIAEITMPASLFLGGFGKGSFKLTKSPNEELPARSVPFRLTSSDDIVVINQVPMTLEKAIADERKKKPDCIICYGKMTPSADHPAKFAVEMVHNVYFLPQEDQGSSTISNIAAQETPAMWNSVPTAILWHCKWGVKGLSPMKPAVHNKSVIIVPPGRAVKIFAPL